MGAVKLRWTTLDAVILLVGALATANAPAADYAGLTLEQAIHQLERQGARVLYSSALVKPDMRVQQEPTSTSPRGVLEEIVAPYGLAVRVGPGGSWLLARARGPAGARNGRIAGTLRHVEDGSPIPGIIVRLGSIGADTSTGADGGFEFAAVAPGRHVLRIADREIVPVNPPTVDVSEGHTTRITLAVRDLRPAGIEEIVVSTSQYELAGTPTPPPAVLTGAQLQLSPDLGDDPMRAVMRLPGAVGGDLTARANVRGGETDETLVRFDGLRLYDPFHLKDFQGVFSALDPAVVSAIDVYTGGFPAGFGDRMSAVMDVKPVLVPEPLRREVSLSFLHASALAGGSFDDGDGDWLLSARRSNLDILFNTLNLQQYKPKYVDAYGRLAHRLTDSLTLSGNFLVFDDDIELTDTDQEEQATATYRDEYFWMGLSYLPSNTLRGQLIAGHSRLTGDRQGQTDQPGVARGQLTDSRSFTTNSVQTDWSWQARPAVMLQFGGEGRWADGRYDFSDEAQFDLLFDTPGAPTEPILAHDLNPRPHGAEYGVYASLRLEPTANLVTETGLRWDKETLSSDNDAEFSPRIGLLYRLGERTDLRAGWGRFFQAQGINELQVSDGVAEFFPAQRADHLIASIEHRLAGGVSVRAEAFRKDYSRLRPRFENLLDNLVLLPELKPDRIRVAPTSATADGVELALSQGKPGPLSWNLSYSLASVKDEVGGSNEPRNWDQTHTVMGNITWQGEHWDFSLAGSWHSGWPTTAIELGATDPIPIVATGPRNGETLSPYMRLDGRVARHYRVSADGELTLFLEVANLTNRNNSCCVEYEVNSDNGELDLDSQTLDYLPIFPSLGFTWRF